MIAKRLVQTVEQRAGGQKGQAFHHSVRQDVEESASGRIFRPQHCPGAYAQQNVAHVTQAGVGQQALDLSLAQRHQITNQHIDRGKTQQQCAPGNGHKVQCPQRAQHRHQAGFDDHTGKHGADAAGRLRVGIRQPGVQRNQGSLDAKPNDEQRPGCQH